MSETIYNVIAVHSREPEYLKNFITDVSGRQGELIGSRVSKRWRNALIEDLRFAYIEDVRAKAKWPEDIRFADSTILYELPGTTKICCAYYAFYSRALGGGLGEYFLDASLRFPKLRFVVQWLYPDTGEIGVQEIEGAAVVGEELYEFSRCGERFFRAVSKEYFGVAFSLRWFGGGENG